MLDFDNTQKSYKQFKILRVVRFERSQSIQYTYPRTAIVVYRFFISCRFSFEVLRRLKLGKGGESNYENPIFEQR